MLTSELTVNMLIGIVKRARLLSSHPRLLPSFLPFTRTSGTRKGQAWDTRSMIWDQETNVKNKREISPQIHRFYWPASDKDAFFFNERKIITGKVGLIPANSLVKYCFWAVYQVVQPFCCKTWKSQSEKHIRQRVSLPDFSWKRTVILRRGEQTFMRRARVIKERSELIIIFSIKACGRRFDILIEQGPVSSKITLW